MVESRRKKVVIISSNSDEAGAPRHCETLIKALSGRYDFTFISGGKGPVHHRLCSSGVNTVWIPGLRSEINPFRDLFCFLAIFIALLRMRPDIVHLHSAKAGLLGRIIATLINIPTIYTFHGFPWRGMSKIRQKVIFGIEKFFSRLRDIDFILVSENMKREAEEKLGIAPVKLHVIHNGVEKNENMASHDYSEGLKIIMPARVCSAKDHETLLKAVRDLDFPFELTLCGAGTNEANFVDSARICAGRNFEKIQFLGERSDVPHIMSHHNLLVLSSHFEALPLSIIEAMACALPVVASDVGGVSELVSKESGKLFAVGDQQELAQHLRFFCEPKNRKTYGLAGHKRFLERFDVDRMAHFISAIYDKKLYGDKHYPSEN